MVPNRAYDGEEDMQRWLVQLLVPKSTEVEDSESEAKFVRKTEPDCERERSAREEQEMLCTTFVP